MDIEKAEVLTLARPTMRGRPIYWLGLRWAVTEDGVTTRDGAILIEPARLYEHGEVEDWAATLALGDMLDRDDFGEALAVARGLWPRESAAPDAVGLGVTDAYVAWCPNGGPYRDHARRGEIVVGLREDVARAAEGPPGSRLPLSRRVCATGTLEARTSSERIALLFMTFNMLVVRDRLDPLAVHRAFLAIDEYRLCLPPDMPDEG